MNIFILTTGRSGSVTFDKACQHITNYSSSHESRARILGDERLNYPGNHIEADNRLSWFLGRLDEKYGNTAFYVHLKRNDNDTAKSYSQRMFPGGIIPAYKKGIMLGLTKETCNVSVSLDYCNTVNSNITCFLKDKDKKLNMNLENIKEGFRVFWDAIGAEGDLVAALAEFDTNYNQLKDHQERRRKKSFIHRIKKLFKR